MTARLDPAPRRPHVLDQWELRFAIAGLSQVVVILAVHLAHLPRGASFGALLVVTAAFGLSVGPLAAGSLGLVGWALFTGFVTNAYGQLTFRAEDVRLLGLLVVLSAGASYARRRTSTHPDRTPQPRP